MINALCVTSEHLRKDEQLHLTKKVTKSNKKVEMISSLPTSVDWRTKGAVSPVQIQGSCGSDYIFAAIDALESAYFIKYNTLPVLSIQQPLDCSFGAPYNNLGCNGGSPAGVFEYLRANKIQPASTYAYTGKRSTCTASSSQGITKITSYSSGKVLGNLQAIVAQQPAVVQIDGSLPCFQSYKSGILFVCSYASTLNMYVLVVGYGTENGVDYWILKNTWGTQWGDKGYIRIARTSDSVGTVGINTSNYYIPNI